MSRFPLNRNRILTQALDLVDANGIGSLTMRKLGEALGVEAMSLYNHVANKDQIIDGLVDLVFAEITLPPVDLPWDQAMSVRTKSARESLVRHPWANSLMDSRPHPGPATLRHHDSVLGCLRRAGFSLTMTAHAISVIDGYLYGFCLQQRSLPFETEEDVAAVGQALMAGFPLGEYPYLGEMIRDHALQKGYDYGLEFDFGLNLILAGLEGYREL